MHNRNSIPSPLILAVSLCFSLILSSHAETPKPLAVFPTEEVFQGLDEELFPLGWSKDGEKLAILSAFPNEAADDRKWSVLVLDLVNDKRVLDLEIFHLDKGGFASFWTEHGTTVQSAIEPFSIETTEFALSPFPALLGKYRGDPYEVSLDRSYGMDSIFGYRGLETLKVNLSNGDGKSKAILDTSWDEFYPLAAGVVGYLPNPQGDRIAVLVATIHRGYEAAPHIRRFVISGARVGEKF